MSLVSISYTSDNLCDLQVSEYTVKGILSSIDKTKGSGCDGIHSIFLSQCAESLAFPITHIFNDCLQQGICPQIWKQAYITPVHKKGSKSCIDNYRPISKLNILSKLLEKVVYNSIYPTLSRAISERQHGFMKNRSTTSNLTSFTDFVLNGMEKGGQVDVVYTDFEKAFDRVDHIILLAKLQALGIRGNLFRWVQSYLSNRSQAVVLGGFKSDFISIPSGVPQGSHLGPLFYNVYIHDINSCFQNSHHLLYADDKKVYMKIRSIEDCILLQNDLTNLQTYYDRNNIAISIGKCQCISFTRKHKPISFNYNFNNVTVQRVELVRDLGVWLDSKMLMSHHVGITFSKAYRNLGFVLRTCKAFKNVNSLLVVYYAYVRSILEYASPIWSPCYITYKQKIERTQKIFLKHLNFRNKIRFNDYTENCRHFNLLTLDERRSLMDMSLLYDLLRGRLDCPELLARLALAAPRRRTRHTPLLHVPPHSTNYAQNAVLSRLPRLYNKKFSEVDIFSGSKLLFKNNIKKVILT